MLAAAVAAGCGGAPSGPRRGAPARATPAAARAPAAPARLDGCVAAPRDLGAPGPFAIRRARAAVIRRSAITGAHRHVDPVLWSPPGRCRRPLILFSHGHYGDPMSCSRLCGHLASLGFAVLAVRHDDRPTPTNLQAPERVDDLLYALDHRLWRRLAPRLRIGAIGVAGHSFGGRSAAELAAQDRRIRALLTMAGGADRATTAEIRAPTLMLAGSEDTVDPPRLSVASGRALPRTTPHAVQIIAGADHGALVDGCAAARTCAMVARAASAHFLHALAGR